MKEKPSTSEDLDILKLTGWVSLSILLVFILKTLGFIFIPLSIALLILFALGIPLDFLEKRGVPDWLRIGLVILFILVVFYMLGKLVHLNIENFSARLPEFQQKFWDYFGALLAFLDIRPAEAQEAWDSFLKKFNEEGGIETFGVMLNLIGGTFFQFIGNFFWVLLFLVFIMAERATLKKRMDKGLGSANAVRALEAGRKIVQAVQHYLGLKTFVSFLTGFLAGLVLWLLDVPFAFLWGVLTFLLNFIPNIGSMIATVPPVAIALFHFGSLDRPLLAAVLLIVIQITVGNFLEPKMMGKGLNLSPMVVLLALLFWGWLWGPVGMLLSVPITAAIKIALEQFKTTRPAAVLMSAD
jgi:predicted PurR-regulated permease PerM